MKSGECHLCLLIMENRFVLPHHRHRNITSPRSQNRTLRKIELTRMGKRILKRLLIVIAVVLAIIVALSYILISKEEAPNQLEIPEKGFHSIF